MTDQLHITDVAPSPPVTQRVPINLLSDLLFALLTAGDVVQSVENAVITGSTLREVLCNLMDSHPEPTVRQWVQQELRKLDEGKLIW